MDTFDIALIVAALGVAALTFTQPPIAVIADIAAVYAASVLAGILYRPASQFAMLRFLPDGGMRTVRIVVFVALLIGGALLLRGLLRRVAGLMAVSRLAAGPLLGNLLSAGLAVVLALGVVLLAVVAVVTVAQIPSSVGIVAFAREQTVHSTLLPRLAEPLTIYLRLVGLFFPHGLPEVYNTIAGRAIPT